MTMTMTMTMTMMMVSMVTGMKSLMGSTPRAIRLGSCQFSCSALLQGRKVTSSSPLPPPLCLRLAGSGASSMADAGAEDLEKLTVEVLKQRCREQGLQVGEGRAFYFATALIG